MTLKRALMALEYENWLHRFFILWKCIGIKVLTRPFKMIE